MALTRRTLAFAALADRVARLLEEHSAHVRSEEVDAVLNHRIEQVSEQMGVSPRTALRYAPADLPETTAALILEVLATREDSRAPSLRRHLRLVEPAPGSPGASGRRP
ncbi:hypothetical protein Cma02nite_18630 [Cellulomonas marina]|uniref:Uncharacterized protein n=1 Tax=Cellulomonas marina TaxID=988821 RepID=A0A1I1AVL9_9CELL|nr:hypothetical protein Cma02nite_18630 [Cellulomonas marina]SFB40478.1 hypothetical protein SAMN05421867_12160 [Cellulomonas marina]